MGEYCVAQILNIAKRIPSHGEQHKERAWKPIQQQSLNKQVLGILGCGGIGLHTAKFIRNFGIRIIGTTRRCIEHTTSADSKGIELTDDEKSLVDEWYPVDEESMIEVFRRSDYVICSIPFTPATTNCIKDCHFEALGSEGWFINVARGEVVDQDAMIKALNSDVFGGAVLDVTTPEPLPSDHPLWTAKNCLITPHDSPLSPASFARSFEHFLNNSKRFIKREPLIALVSDVANSKSLNKIFW